MINLYSYMFCFLLFILHEMQHSFIPSRESQPLLTTHGYLLHYFQVKILHYH